MKLVLSDRNGAPEPEIITLFYHSEPENITVKIEEGKTLNITCRFIMEPESSSVIWLKDNRPIKKASRSRFLFIQSIKRSQAGDYKCVSLSPHRNYSSPFTAVDVLCKYLKICVTFRENCAIDRYYKFFFMHFSNNQKHFMQN